MLYGKYSALGDLEIIVPGDDAAAKSILLALNLAAQGRGIQTE